jgi:hypothetical protein
MLEQFRNVGEPWLLYDTVRAGGQVGFGPWAPPTNQPPGWFQTLQQLGAATELSFFNVRNRSIGLPWNNQDTRDQMPFALKLDSIGVSFFATDLSAVGAYPNSEVPFDHSILDIIPHIFMVDLPRHCSVTLQVAQDELMKNTAYLCPPGYGPVGSGYGRGAPSTITDNGFDGYLGTASQSSSILTNRWMFPQEIEIPNRASLSVKVKLSEYGRRLVNELFIVGSGISMQTGDGQTDYQTLPIEFGIQVSLVGQRLVQQRGQLHA